MQNLRLFSDVARCHSISLAAEMHGISQSAVSQRINQLEKHLGVILLNRSVRPLELTDAGRVFLAGVGDVLQRYDKLERAVAASATDPAGGVRISAIYSSGIDLLRQATGEFEQQRPQIVVHIDYEKPDAVHESVVSGRADVGLLSYPDRFKKVDVVALRDEEMAVVCPPDHALAAYPRVEARQLRGLEMVGFDTDLPVGRRIAGYLKEHDASPTTAHSFDNLDTIKSAVAATGRFAILPRRTVRREVEAGTLVVVGLSPRLVRPMGLIYRRSTRQSPALTPAASVFVEFLVKHAGQHEATPPGNSQEAAINLPSDFAPPAALAAGSLQESQR